jgi:hypothetical protein
MDTRKNHAINTLDTAIGAVQEALSACRISAVMTAEEYQPLLDAAERFRHAAAAAAEAAGWTRQATYGPLIPTSQDWDLMSK